MDRKAMEKKRIASLAALVALTVLAGCRHVEQECPSTVKTVQFHAGMPETRTAFAEAVDGVYQTLWTENDSEVLLSLNYGKAEPSAVTLSADGKTASFAASFDAGTTTSPYTFYAVSPASVARAISPSRQAWSIYIAADQAPSALSVDEEVQLLVAKSAASATLPDEVDLHFSHLTAYGRITLRNLELGEAVVDKAELVFSVPVVGEWYWGEDGTLTANGASHTITLETDATSDLWFACAPVDVSGATMKLTLFTDQGALTKEITFPQGRRFTSGKVARFSVDMTGYVLEKYAYVPVTDAATLEAGDKLLIVNADATYALGAQVSSGTAHRAQAAVTEEDGRIVDPGQATVLTLSAGLLPGTWSFHTGTGYLSSATSQNVLKESSMKDSYSSWQVTISGRSAMVRARKGSSTYIRYNAEDGFFSCYPTSTTLQGIALYRWEREPFVPVTEDPLAASLALGSYLPGAQRTYVPGTDQISRSYDGDGKLVFSLLDASQKERLTVSGFDPSLVKGDEVTVMVSYRKGREIYLENQAYTLRVVREDGSRVWLGNGTGEGIILKK